MVQLKGECSIYINYKEIQKVALFFSRILTFNFPLIIFKGQMNLAVTHAAFLWEIIITCKRK